METKIYQALERKLTDEQKWSRAEPCKEALSRCIRPPQESIIYWNPHPQMKSYRGWCSHRRDQNTTGMELLWCHNLHTYKKSFDLRLTLWVTRSLWMQQKRDTLSLISLLKLSSSCNISCRSCFCSLWWSRSIMPQRQNLVNWCGKAKKLEDLLFPMRFVRERDWSIVRSSFFIECLVVVQWAY